MAARRREGEASRLVRQRYRGDDAPAPVAWNDTLAVILGHRSVRAFLPDPLAGGTLETLVAAAQSAASSSNLQVWSVVAVEDPARKARLAALAANQKHIVEAPLILVWLIAGGSEGELAAHQRQGGCENGPKYAIGHPRGDQAADDDPGHGADEQRR